MEFRLRYTNAGTTMSIGDEERPRLAPVANTPQDHPRNHYVYAHLTPAGQYFYIGKGQGNRAWATSARHSTWQRYVSTRLNGPFKVLILQDDLSLEAAEDLEAEWIAQEGKTLVNWVNSERDFNYENLKRYHELRDANRQRIANAKKQEKIDIHVAIAMYHEAIAAIDSYANLELETGLVAELAREERLEIGQFGQVEAIERLVMCLLKLGSLEEAQRLAEDYFTKYAGDKNFSPYARTQDRLTKAAAKQKRL
jgi:hypothetical protein